MESFYEQLRHSAEVPDALKQSPAKPLKGRKPLNRAPNRLRMVPIPHNDAMTGPP